MGSRCECRGSDAEVVAERHADVVSGNVPPALQLNGPEIAAWAASGLTADLDAVAAKMQTAGIHPVAHSTQDWIDTTPMDNIVCGMDIELHRRDARPVGSPMRFAVDMGKACLFDPASERLI